MVQTTPVFPIIDYNKGDYVTLLAVIFLETIKKSENKKNVF